MKKLMKNLAKLALLAVFVLSIMVTAPIAFEHFLYTEKGKSVVKITRTTAGRSGGTGFQIRTPSGKLRILTNAHICQMGKILVAHTQSGKKQKSKVIKIYPKHDLCLMEPVKGVPPLKIAKSINLRERVWLIGHPALRDLTLQSGHFVGNTTINLWTECKDKFIGKKLLDAMFNPDLDKKELEKLLQYVLKSCTKKMTSQHINNISYGGNSGSPIINKFGNVVGVLYAGRRDQPTASHTVPLEEIHKFLKDK